jgi:hypothetical protein
MYGGRERRLVSKASLPGSWAEPEKPSAGVSGGIVETTNL